MVGKMLFDLGAWRTTRRTLERVLQVDANDLDANLWLGTAYQRAGRPHGFRPGAGPRSQTPGRNAPPQVRGIRVEGQQREAEVGRVMDRYRGRRSRPRRPGVALPAVGI